MNNVSIQPLGKQCEHGSLARSCEICERDAEIKDLDTQVINFQGINDFYLQCLGALNAEIAALRQQMTVMCDRCPAQAAVFAVENIAHVCPELNECDDCICHINEYRDCIGRNKS
jgi:hypothetical protein